MAGHGASNGQTPAGPGKAPAPGAGAPRRRTLRRIGAVLAGFLAIVVLSIATDLVMHATGVFPPFGQPMSHAIIAIAMPCAWAGGKLRCEQMRNRAGV